MQHFSMRHTSMRHTSMGNIILSLCLFVMSLNVLAVTNQVVTDPELNNKVSEASKVVDEHLIAYNNRDLDAFVSAFHDDIEISTFPNQIDLKGKAELEKLFGNLFKRVTSLKATITHREIKGRFVVDSEHVVSSYLLNGKEHEYVTTVIAIYEVVDKKIKRIQFIRSE